MQRVYRLSQGLGAKETVPWSQIMEGLDLSSSSHSAPSDCLAEEHPGVRSKVFVMSAQGPESDPLNPHF